MINPYSSDFLCRNNPYSRDYFIIICPCNGDFFLSLRHKGLFIAYIMVDTILYQYMAEMLRQTTETHFRYFV